MNKFRLCLVTLGLIVAACSPAVVAPTNELPATSIPGKGDTPTAAPAITEQVGTAVLSTAMPAVTSAAGATIGGPVVITVQPSNGTPQPPGPGLDVTATPIPTLSGGLSPSELKYRVLAAYPNIFFCDPDFYPVARGDEATIAEARFPEIQANTEEFNAIVAHLQLAGVKSFASDQKLLIYREHKKLQAVRFKLAGGQYQFQLQTKDANGNGLLVTGLIDGQGAISNQQSQPSVATCPICLSAQTKIDTPRGPVAVTDLQPGDVVWTVDADGARVAAPILNMVHVPVPATHEMVHLKLADGRELWASPGHPTSDGRSLGDLKAGGLLDGVRIVTAERVLYGQPATYDLLPDSATGFYWANGILIGSTLK